MTPTSPQPPPVNAPDAVAIWPLVRDDLQALRSSDGALDARNLLLADMHARDAFGRAKYGVPLTAQNGRDHLADALQEALDGLAYMRAELHGLREETPYRARLRRLYLRSLWHTLELRALIASRST